VITVASTSHLDGRSGSFLITGFQTIHESLETHRQACSVRRHAIPDVRNSFAARSY